MSEKRKNGKSKEGLPKLAKGLRRRVVDHTDEPDQDRRPKKTKKGAPRRGNIGRKGYRGPR